MALSRVSVVGLVVALLCVGCGGGEQDVVQRVETWLSLLGARRDAEAMALVADSRLGDTIDEEAFGRLVDRHPILRNTRHTEWHVEIEGRDFRPLVQPSWRIEGTLINGDTAHRLRALVGADGRIGGVRIDERFPLLPPVYRVAPTPPPEPLVLTGLGASVEAGRLTARGRTHVESGAVTVRLDARCRYGTRWQRAVLDRPRQAVGGEELVEGSVPLEAGAPDLCEATLSVLQARTRSATFCWTRGGTTPGACPEAPVGEPGATPPVAVSEVEVGDSAVHYQLDAREALPERHGPSAATIVTLVSCPDGRQDEHGRPIAADDIAPGERRRYGSIFSPRTWPDGFPPGCAVQLRYRTRSGEDALLWQGTTS